MTVNPTETLTIRTPGEPTEHRPLRDGELDEWLDDPRPCQLTDEERAALEVRIEGLRRV